MLDSENMSTRGDKRTEKRMKTKYAQVKHSTMGLPRGLTKMMKRVLGFTGQKRKKK